MLFRSVLGNCEESLLYTKIALNHCLCELVLMYGRTKREVRPVLKPPKRRLTCLFCVMLCQFSLKCIQYSCGKLTLPDTKNPVSFGTSTVLEQVYLSENIYRQQYQLNSRNNAGCCQKQLICHTVCTKKF